jgi:hypothetical protein
MTISGCLLERHQAALLDEGFIFVCPETVTSRRFQSKRAV